MILMLTNYRLYDALSGSIDNLIFKSTISIKLSFLHFGQKIGKYFTIVSFRILVRVLHLHFGQCIQPFSSTQKDFAFCIYPPLSFPHSVKNILSTRCYKRNAVLGYTPPLHLSAYYAPQPQTILHKSRCRLRG